MATNTGPDVIVLPPPEEQLAEAAPAPSSPAAAKLTPREWATRKGFVRKVVSGVTVHHPELPYVEGAIVKNKWDEFFLVTEAEFDAAVEDAKDCR